MLFMLFADIGEEIIITDINRATLIQQIKYTFIEWLDKLDDLDIICKIQFRNNTLQTLLPQNTLLMYKYLLQINLMYLFICIIDTELFKTIMIKYLKTIDVQ